MSDIHIRIEGRVGRVTLRRPEALNALTPGMADAIERALDGWAGNDEVRLLLLDAEGEKAFCSGGDIADLYRAGNSGDFAHGRRFWRDEYRMNRKMFRFPKPVVSFLQGFVMGGGVGIGCHGSHRIVGDSTKVAMPECGIGLVPDVGGSLILARAPGRLGEYLALTSFRMGPGDAIHAGFADYYLPESEWEELKSDLVASGEPEAVDRAAAAVPDGEFKSAQSWIDSHFAGERLRDILNSLRTDKSGRSAEALDRIGRNSPLSMACSVEMIHRLRGASATIERALELEYRYTWRAMESGDFLEGIRAAIIDKDRSPNWRHPLDGVPTVEVSRMLAPLEENALEWEDSQ